MQKTKNSIKKILTIILSVVFLLSPFSFSFNNIETRYVLASDPEIVFPDDQDRIMKLGVGWHQWRKNDEIEINGTIVVENGAMLTIEAGTTIKFRKEEGEVAPFIYVEKGGMLLAEGTESERIVFTSDQEESHFSLIFDGHNNRGGAYSGFLRYVEISRAGGEYELGKPHQTFLPFRKNDALAEDEENLDYRFPVRHLGGTLVMENCRFNNNQSADFYVSENEIDPRSIDSNDGRLVSVINSNFENNQVDIAVIDNHTCPESDEITQNDCEKLVTLKNNYYGNKFGPYLLKQSYDYYLEHEEWYDEFVGKIIGENVSYPDFRKKALIADPAIIIPGITGSSMSTKTGFLGKLELDPILHTYDDLRESMMDNGYEKNINLFEFPYEWRNSNEITAQELKEKIQEIQVETLISRVDLVAHSMGGLVSRKYIQENDYGWNVDQLITLGTPHLGSPKSYLMWEAGEGFFRITGGITKHHFRMEAKHNGYDHLFEYIQNEVVSIQELLPIYDYLEQNGEMRGYSNNYPQNVFLENLNNNGLDNLDQIRFLNIVGKTEKDSTIAKIKVTDETDGERWEHGKPENFEDEESDRGLEYGEGDETVPLESATGVGKGKLKELDSTHNGLPTKAQCEVFRELTGEQVCAYKNEWDIPNIFLFNVFSPVDIQIIDPEGKRIGKDFKTGEIINEIDGAYYTGFDTENEFVTIPNPKDGEYQIKTEGTGEGNYKIETVFIEENEEFPEGINESIAFFEGEAQIGVIEENAIILEDGEVTQEEPDTTPPTITIDSPKEKEYFNDQELEAEYQVTDDISEQENISTEIKLDDEIFTQEKLQLPLMTLGSHTFQVIAKDEAGNQVQSKINFNLKTDLYSLVKNVNYYYQKNLINHRGIKRVIQNNLRQTQKLVDHKNKIISCYKFRPRQKRLLENIFNRIIKRRIALINKYINWGEKKRFIGSIAKERLIEGLNSLEY